MVLQTYPRALESFLLILVPASIAKQTDSAIKQFQNLQSELRKSHASNQWHSNLVSANKLKGLMKRLLLHRQLGMGCHR
jgi:hypothetical protein